MSPRSFWLPALLFALLWLLPLGAHDLFDPDEGRYAEVPRAMVATGDWVTPRLDGLKYFEKPALQYWATAVAYEIFGVSEWSARLFTALCALGGAVLAWWVGRRLYGERVAAYAALLLGGTVLYAGTGRLVTLDMALCFGLQVCLTGLLLLRPESTRNEARLGAVLLGLGMVVALLVKGLVGILIPVAVAGLCLLLWRDWGLLWRARPWWSLAALALLGAPWFIVVTQRNPEFAHFFFIHEHFERYLTRVHQRYEPDWFFLPVLLVGFLPFVTLLPGAVASAWRAARGGDRAAGLLLAWAGFIFGFFSLSQSKLIPYVLPAWPALALLVARALPQLPARRLAGHLLAVAVLTLVLPLALVAVWLLPVGALVAKTGPVALGWLLAAAVVWVLGSFAGWWLARRERTLAALVCEVVGLSLFVQGLLMAGSRLPGRDGVQQMAETAAPLLAPDTPVYCVSDYLQSVNFYLRRNCTLVGYQGELEFGISQQPQAYVADLGAFGRRWSDGSQALALMPPQTYELLRGQMLPMRLIYTSPNIVAVLRQ